MRHSSMVTLGSMAGLSMSADNSTGYTAKVVLIRHEEVIDAEHTIRKEVIRSMLDQALIALLGSDTPEQAWSSLIKPNDIVGIKSNAWRFLPTPPELEQAIIDRVVSAGVPQHNVAVDDREILHNPIFQKATALINVRPLRTHHWAGIGGVLKNMIMFVPDPYNYHDDSCADLGKVWQLPLISGKTRLNILSCIRIQYHGRGPHHFDKRYLTDYKGLLIGTDPVAVDATGLRLIQAQRMKVFGEKRNLATPPHHILYADKRYKLGTSDPSRIELVKIGPITDMLI
ncbi:DUF362 domain-containing protein [bacterium]|nr:DUF362 domain-containing protein [bacterium]